MDVKIEKSADDIINMLERLELAHSVFDNKFKFLANSDNKFKFLANSDNKFNFLANSDNNGNRAGQLRFSLPPSPKKKAPSILEG